MRIIILGAPGTGKGTQAQFIMDKYSIPRISTGDMLRNAVNKGSPLGNQVDYMMKAGKLVPDKLVMSLVRARITQKDCYNGFLLDGFPRTISQARAMQEFGINVDYVLEFDVSDELIIERIIGRRIHVPSGRIYHVKFNPPQVEGQDDLTHEELITRNDDQEETVYNRLKEYHEITMPLISYYSKKAAVGKFQYYKINGARKISVVSAELSAILG